MITAPESLQSVFDRAFAGISQVREAFAPQLTPREVGAIISVATGIAKVSGLPSVGFEELVKFPGDVLGIAFNVDEDEIGVVLLGEYWHLHAGDEVDVTIARAAPHWLRGDVVAVHPQPRRARTRIPVTVV